MNQDERSVIRDLFGKLEAVERQAPPRDPEAERFIHDRISAQPGAPYYMAQTIVMQEQALIEAQRRIEELEAASAPEPETRGGFGGLWGARPPAPRATGGSVPGRVPSMGARGGMGGMGAGMQGMRPGMGGGMGGGGFLAGAAQTAMGVAGGMLLGSMLAGMFTGDEANAAETPAEEPPAEDPGVDDGDMDFGGGDEF